MRPLAAYHIFFQIEREYIIQNASPELVDTDSKKSYLTDVPQRYRSIKLLHDWYAGPGKRQKRKHRKSHGMIGFFELSRVISRRWATLETEDLETKEYVTRIAAREMEEYKLELKEYQLLTGDMSGNTRSVKKPSNVADAMTVAPVVVADRSSQAPARRAMITPIASPKLHNGDYVDAVSIDNFDACYGNFAAVCNDIQGEVLNSSEVDYSIATVSNDGNYLPSHGLVDSAAFDPLLESSQPDELSTDPLFEWMYDSGEDDSVFDFVQSLITGRKHCISSESSPLPSDMDVMDVQSMNGNDDDDFLALMSLSEHDEIHNVESNEANSVEGAKKPQARAKNAKKTAPTKEAVSATDHNIAKKASAIVAGSALERAIKMNSPEKMSLFCIEEAGGGRGGETPSAKRAKVSTITDDDDTVEEDAKGLSWEDEETNILLHHQSVLGNKWSEIAKHIPGRNAIAVMNRWYYVKRKNEEARKKTSNADRLCIDNALDEREETNLRENNFYQDGYRKPLQSFDVKPQFQVGCVVYSAWWDPKLKVKNRKNAFWFPGEVIGVSNKVGHFSRYGPTRLYDIRHEDNAVQYGVEDYWVCSKRDYELNVKLYSMGMKPIGVIEKFDTCSNDQWARMVGWYEVNVDGEDKAFSFLEDAMKAHDSCVIRKHGTQTKISYLNQPECYPELFHLPDIKFGRISASNVKSKELEEASMKDALGCTTAWKDMFSLG